MSYYQSFDEVPGVFPYQPPSRPDPETCPERTNNPNHDPGTDRARVTGRSKNAIEAVKEMGTTQVPEIKSNIHCMTIVGQIEGQPSMLKKPKYWFCGKKPKHYKM